MRHVPPQPRSLVTRVDKYTARRGEEQEELVAERRMMRRRTRTDTVLFFTERSHEMYALRHL